MHDYVAMFAVYIPELLPNVIKFNHRNQFSNKIVTIVVLKFSDFCLVLMLFFITFFNFKRKIPHSFISNCH